MNKKQIFKESKDYLSIFTFFCIIFMMFQNNIVFAGSTCQEAGSFRALDRCRENNFFVSNDYDLDGNKTIECGEVSMDKPFNPYEDKDYYYNSSNEWCLSWGVGILTTYTITAQVADKLCVSPDMTGGAIKIAEERTKKISKFTKILKALKSVGTRGLSVIFHGALALQVDPKLLIQKDLVKDSLYLSYRMGKNLLVQNYPAAAICAGWITGLVAIAEGLFFSTTGALYESSRMQINNIKVCGDDWYSYAYTGVDMNAPESEWYPQYGQFSNSYSYKVAKTLAGVYSCKGYLKDETKIGDDNNKESELKKCPSNCKNKVNECLKNNRTSNNDANIDFCLSSNNDCSEYCRGYYIKCEPMLTLLEDDGICSEDSSRNFDCKSVKPYFKNYKNRLYRESIYKGKEFKISTNYNDSNYGCYDPRLELQKGYSGDEQRYYLRGKSAGQYACNRFDYKNEGCRIIESNGRARVITKQQAAEDENLDIQCKVAFMNARGCCQQRRTRGICLYPKTGRKSGRNNNTMCLKNMDGSTSDKCRLNTGETAIRDPFFRAFPGQIDSTKICAENVNFCPYSYNVSGGTELQQLYCDGDYNNKNCGDYYKIWKKSKYKTPTMAYGQTKNFCYHLANCTEIGEDEFSFVSMNDNKFMPKVCSDFIGDSQNLPYPIRPVDIGIASSVRKIYSMAGLSLGDETTQSINNVVDSMNNNQVAQVYAGLLGQQLTLSVLLGFIGGATFSEGIVGLIVGAISGAVYTTQDIIYAVNNDSNSKNTLKTLTINSLIEPIAMDFSLGEYRGFSAPIAQCVRETLYNMFHNISGQSQCKNKNETINSEGLCGNDTFGPPARIRNYKYNPIYIGDKDAYYYVIGEALPNDSNILYKIQTRLQGIIKLAAILALFVIGLKYLMGDKIDIFNDLKGPKALIVGMLKFAIVLYFAVGNAWQSKFYDWIDKSTQYLYYKAFDLSLVGYKDYKNTSEKLLCTVDNLTQICKNVNNIIVEDACIDYSYTGSVQTFTVPEGVSEVKLEVWGAQGGRGGKGAAGNGGYSYGNYKVKNGDKLYIEAGGIGIDNGSYGGGGGGSSQIKTVQNSEISIIVAGGGGGSGGSWATNLTGCDGGLGGGGGKNGENSKKITQGFKDEEGFDASKGGIGGLSSNSGKGGNSAPNGILGGWGGTTNIGSGKNGALWSGGGGGGGGSGGRGGESCGAGGGGSYIGGVFNGGGTNGVNTGNGKAKICYTINRSTNEMKCETSKNTELAKEIIDKNIFNISPFNGNPPSGQQELCLPQEEFTNEEGTQIKTCYHNCASIPKFDENGIRIYEYSDTYDGCYFGDNVYPDGKSYLGIFDSLDCKLVNYFNYGPDMDLPGILHMLLISLFWSPLALVIVILGTLLFVIVLVITIKVLYMFLLSMFAINILIYLSPIIFPSLLFAKYKGIFTKWLEHLISFSLQFMFVVIFVGFFIGTFERFSIGSAKFFNHDSASGRLPTTICGDSVDSILCIFKINVNKGTKPIFGETVYRIFGIGPVVSVIDSITKDFAGTVMTLLKFCLIMYVFSKFLSEIPGVITSMIGGETLQNKDVSVGGVMGKIAGVAGGVSKGAKFAMKKGYSAMKDIKNPFGKKDEARSTPAHNKNSQGSLSGINISKQTDKSSDNNELNNVNVSKQNDTQDTK